MDNKTAAQSNDPQHRLLEDLEALLENSLVGILVVHDRYISRINKRGLHILGYTAAELIGKHAEVIHVSRESSEYFGQHYYQMTAHKEMPNIEYPVRRKDGSQIWCNISGKALSPPDLSKGVVWVFEDIDNRKRMEKRLMESEERYRSVFENTGAATIIVEKDSTISMANTEYEKLSGYSKEQIEGKKRWTDFVVEESLGRMRKYHAGRRKARSKMPTVYEFRFRDKKGEIKDILARVGMIPGTDRSVASFMDITSRKRIEEGLKNRLTYETMLSDISSQAVFIQDIDKFQETCLGIMGRTLDVSRIYIFEHRYKTDSMDNTFEWVASGITPEKENLQGIPSSAVPWWIDKMQNNRIINYKDIEDVPGKREKEILRAQGIKSIVVVPIFIKKHYYGFIGFDECRYFRDWLDQDVTLLKTIVHIVAGAIERKMAEDVLRKREEELETQSHHLKEVNTALKVLLEQRERDKKELEKSVLSNVKELVAPYLESLKKSGLDNKQKASLSVLESNLKEIISPFSSRLFARYLDFTPKEIQIADLIRQGKTTKEIAELLDASTRAVEFHRNNLRKKLGIINKKTNLRSYLLSLA